MTATALLDTLKVRGVTVRADGDVLKIKPFSALTDSDRAAIRQNKRELLCLLAPATEQVPQLETKTPEEWEAEAQAVPTMRELFLREVEKQKRPDGFVLITPRLCTLWRCAEEEAGDLLDLAGRQRVDSEQGNTCPSLSLFSQSPDKTSQTTDQSDGRSSPERAPP